MCKQELLGLKWPLPHNILNTRDSQVIVHVFLEKKFSCYKAVVIL